jgi:hypothetical protein
MSDFNQAVGFRMENRKLFEFLHEFTDGHGPATVQIEVCEVLDVSTGYRVRDLHDVGLLFRTRTRRFGFRMKWRRRRSTAYSELEVCCGHGNSSIDPAEKVASVEADRRRLFGLDA